MKPEIAHQLLEKVKLDYDEIANEFSKTRATPWPEFEIFKTRLKPGMAVADIGCGNGRLADELPGNIRYTGIDGSEKLLDQAKKKHPRIVFKYGNMLEIPLEANAFDATFCIASLHHIPSKELREKAIKELARITKPGEYIFITVWDLWQKKYLKNILKAIGNKIAFGDRDWNDLFISWQNTVERYYHAFTQRELRNLLKETCDIEKFYKSHHNIVAICKKK